MITKEVLSGWIKKIGSVDRSIPQENVQALLSGMPLRLTQAEVGEMLECAKDLGERGSHLAYGQNYNFTPLFKKTRGIRQVGKVIERNGSEKKKRPRKMSKRSVGRDVFLGGSCNPTTWRKDVAIPLLDDLGITYFNPQVAEWTEDLVSVEHNAKESATVLFYVLDRRTRNVVGIVEVANFAGSRRDVVLVTDPYKVGEPVAGENISHIEYEELCSGLSTLHDLVARQGILVHGNIKEAIKWTAEILNNSSSPRRKTSLKLSNGLIPDESLRKSKEIPNKVENTKKVESNLTNVCLAYYKTLTDLNGISSKDETGDVIKKNIVQLCSTVNDMKAQNGTADSMFGFNTLNSPPKYEIYVGGSCFDNVWKENIALPLLRESGLNFVFAECGMLKNSRANDREAEAMENSKVLLFIITNRTRGLETMALASYYIGCRKNIVLCIQNLPENAIIGTEVLSKIAVKDYNRGRVYLADLASRSGVPVFDSVEDAVRLAISRCNHASLTSSR